MHITEKFWRIVMKIYLFNKFERPTENHFVLRPITIIQTFFFVASVNLEGSISFICLTFNNFTTNERNEMKREHCTNIYEKCGIARSSRWCFDAKTSFRHEAQGKSNKFQNTLSFFCLVSSRWRRFWRAGNRKSFYVDYIMAEGRLSGFVCHHSTKSFLLSFTLCRCCFG